MREYVLRFKEGLRKGLRSNVPARPGNELLVECHNWMPGEKGLVPHESISALTTNVSSHEGILFPLSITPTYHPVRRPQRDYSVAPPILTFLWTETWEHVLVYEFGPFLWTETWES